MNDRVDPLMKPMAESTSWFESGPDAILKDPSLATLIVRIGMANNALAAQMDAAMNTGQRSPAVKTRNVVCSLVTSAALTDEALKLIASGLKHLRPLAIEGGATPQLLDDIGQLCAGKHPASETLNRARNQIGFHWDDDVVRPSVQAFGRNSKIVWVEADDGHDYVFRLASEVLGHALFPIDQSDDELAQAITVGMDQVVAAMQTIIRFSAASTFAYIRTSGGIMRTTSTKASEEDGA